MDKNEIVKIVLLNDVISVVTLGGVYVFLAAATGPVSLVSTITAMVTYLLGTLLGYYLVTRNPE